VGESKARNGRVEMEPTGTFEAGGGAGEQELVPHLGRLAALGDPRLDVVGLHPLAQPLHRAVAVEGVRAECPVMAATCSPCSETAPRLLSPAL
jgi:hypothetical protein